MLTRSGVVLISLFSAIPLNAQQQTVTVFNSASMEAGMPRGGALATVFVTPPPGGWGSTLVPGVYPQSPPLPSSAQGFTVLVNGASAPILAVAVSNNPNASVQINIQVPMERNASLATETISTSTCGSVNIGTGACGNAGGTLVVGSGFLVGLTYPRSGGGWFQDSNGFAVAQHVSDNSLVTTDNPAHAGEQIVALVDDFFPVWPPAPIAVSALAAYNIDPNAPTPQYLYLQDYVPTPTCTTQPFCAYNYTTTPAVTINAMRLAQNMIGVEQIVFTIPATQQTGTWALFFNSGSCPDGRGAACPGQAAGSNSGPYVLLPVQ
jgi:uncharacterized protein (TIGR03437 family)